MEEGMLVVSRALAWLYLPGAAGDRRPAPRHRWPQVAGVLRAVPHPDLWLAALRREGFWEEALLLEGLPDKATAGALTAVDPEFPSVWVDRLGYRCPPAFWTDGLLGLAGGAAFGGGALACCHDRGADGMFASVRGPRPAVAVVGSRDISAADTALAHGVGLALATHGFLVASGGAPGCDHHAVRGALRGGLGVQATGNGHLSRIGPQCPLAGAQLPVVAWEVLPHGLALSRAQTPWSQSEAQPGICRLSATFGQARFTLPQAIERNTLLYSLGVATVVVRVAAGNGGTWRAATDALRRRLGSVIVFCDDANFGRCAPNFQAGAQGLVARGAHAVQDIEQLLALVVTLGRQAPSRLPLHQSSLFA